ncbi:hypothetical protein MMC34_006835 [Xylographa carneopallida]|nr:hypothetical protein [Xylographa carneopallida]
MEDSRSKDNREDTLVQGPSILQDGAVTHLPNPESAPDSRSEIPRQGAQYATLSTKPNSNPLEQKASVVPISSLDATDNDALPASVEAPTASQVSHEDASSGEYLSSKVENDEETNELSLRAVVPVEVLVSNLTVAIDLQKSGLGALRPPFSKSKTLDPSKPTTKTILDDVSARMPSGSLTAIIGASGSGKTSMLNVMSQRISDSRLKQSGRTLYNGNQNLSSVRSAYVMQQDVLLPTLTVRETLQYSADLRLPPPTTAEERRTIVEEVILELGLKECANTRIGNNEHKGCSGGEKRRTSLAVQLLANPSVLFCDEVTTGLDAASAFQLVKTLKQLARKGRTIIITIHQPRSEIWGLFDHLVLLTRGSPVYSGPAQPCLEYFSKLGHELPPFVNPAEHLIDLAAIDTRSPELERLSLARVTRLKEAWRASPSGALSSEMNEKDPLLEHSDRAPSTNGGRSPFGRQVQVQTLRTIKTTWRDPMGMTGSLVEVLGMSIITGWIFLHLDGSLTGIRSREGALYTAGSLQGYLILLFETYRLTLDIGVFDREYSEGVVSVSSWLLSRRIARLFLEDIPIPLIFSIIFYFMVGFRHNASQFFIFFAIELLGHYLAVTLATLAVAVSRDFTGAVLIANMNFTLQSMCSGFFVQSNQIPVWVRWLKYTAYVWYANGALSANEFLSHTSSPYGQFYDCPEPGGPSNPACLEYTGTFIFAALGYPDNWLWRPIVILTAFVFAFLIGSGVVLRFWKVEMSISKARTSEEDTSVGKEQIRTRSLEEVRTIGIELNGLTLDIQKYEPWGRKAARISILQPINSTFEPGTLNVIMGPSGSGKTSLLNLMASRLYSTFGTRYAVGGTMMYGGSIPSEDVIRSVASYVCQDDDALLATLTVRETLHFAAGLRLPTWMSKAEKKRRAEEVLVKLGLRDCANNLVGNDLIKGISGGEKRRVTIAIQVLTDPRILLLDEPTSGLDAFTASSIIEVLRGLAEEGRTLVLTIHQSRSDLWNHFGNVLLLARGGSSVYAGKGKSMLEHFSFLGYECPKTTNPADFALDLITVDLQHATREARSRAKVSSLISDWENVRRSQLVRTPSHISAPAELGSLKRAMTPFRIAFPLLVQRSLIGFRRDPNAILARTMQVIGFAIIITLFFAPLKSDYESVQSRLGFVQEFVAIYFVGMLQNVAVYPVEKSVFYREHDDRAYSIEAFFLQYTVLEIPFELLACLAFAAIAVFGAGLPRTAPLFLIVAFNAFCVVNCGESIGIMFNTLFAHTGFAVNLTSVVLSVATLMAGVISLDISPFLQAFNHLSPSKWAIGNLAPYSLDGIVFTCTEAQRLPGGQCPIATGEQALQLYNLNGNASLNLMALGIVTVGYRVVAYLLLKAKRTDWGWKERFRKRAPA